MLLIKENVGTIDRYLRLAVAIIFLGLGFISGYSSTWRIVLLLLGTGELFTAATGY